MRGKYSIEIYNNKLHYQFEVKRNITIIQGNSATGKTTLINMIADYSRLGNSSGIVLNCDRKCYVLPNERWQDFIINTKDSIIFVEENMPFIKTEEFAKCLHHSDNYYVIVYRDSLPQLAYSINEIYEIREDRESQKYIKPNLVYQSIFNIYNLDTPTNVTPDVVITEDTNSGHEFFDELFQCDCVSSSGKTKMHNQMKRYANEGKTVLGIVDGAAFGADMQKMMRTISEYKNNCIIYAPESFEYLLLKSNIFNVPNGILEETYDYAESKIYDSWEQFFTEQLRSISLDAGHNYSKRHLDRFFLSNRCITKVKKLMEFVNC